MTVVRMWEARVVPGRLEDAVAWLVEAVVPDALAADGCLGAEAFRALGGEERVVLITRWPGEPVWAEPEPAEPLLERAHAWSFAPAT